VKNWKKYLEKFSRGYGKLSSLVESLSEEDLNSSLNEDSWTIRQIIHHLADGAMIWGMFIRQALGDPGGEFKLQWYWDRTQDEWAEIWNYSGRDIQSSLELYGANQDSMLSILGSVEKPESFSLQMNLPGEKVHTHTIENAIRWQNIHIANHIKDIRQILGEKKE
jgi:hypothetical protein